MYTWRLFVKYNMVFMNGFMVLVDKSLIVSRHSHVYMNSQNFIHRNSHNQYMMKDCINWRNTVFDLCWKLHGKSVVIPYKQMIYEYCYQIEKDMYEMCKTIIV